YHFLGLNQSIIGKCFLGGHIALANGDQIVWYLQCVGFVCLANVPDLVRWVKLLYYDKPANNGYGI
ncbi:MAG: hypothetical protein Q7U17_05585, partial [Sediminibacterium sp.]|nr:hypothetical protein [Sediminibacterium sp.]